MRIAHLINDLRVGGPEKSLVITFAGEMRRRGVDFTLITLRHNDPIYEEMAEARGTMLVNFSHRKIFAPGRFWKLARFLGEQHFDVLHTHLTMANILGAAAGWITGTPVVTTLHNTLLGSEKRAIHHALETWLLDHTVRRVVAVGWETAAAQQRRLKNRPLLVIPNAVENPPSVTLEERERLRQELSGDPSAPVLVFVGRFVPQKGIEDLLQAFASVHKVYPQARIALVGDGPSLPAARDLIRHLGLERNTRLLGLRNDVTHLLAAADIFVSASRWEGLPVATLEAMAAGLPVVATTVGDLPHVITPGTGILTPAGEPEKLASAICELLGDANKRRTLGSAARERVLAEFSAKTWADKTLQLYEEIIKGG